MKIYWVCIEAVQWSAGAALWRPVSRAPLLAVLTFRQQGGPRFRSRRNTRSLAEIANFGLDREEFSDISGSMTGEICRDRAAAKFGFQVLADKSLRPEPGRDDSA